jgi:hypothetical protein
MFQIIVLSGIVAGIVYFNGFGQKQEVKTIHRVTRIEYMIHSLPDNLSQDNLIRFLNSNSNIEFQSSKRNKLVYILLAQSGRITESLNLEELSRLGERKRKVGILFVRIASSCKALTSYKNEIASTLSSLHQDRFQGFEIVISPISSKIFFCNGDFENLIKFLK